MRNRLRYENQMKTNPEIEELRIICYEEVNQVRRLQFEELSLRHKRDPNTVSRLLKQIQELQDQLNPSAGEREFHDPETASGSGASHVPTQPRDYSEFKGNAWPRFWIADYNTGYYE